MGEFNLLDLKFILTPSGEMAFWEEFPTYVMARGDFERGNITPYAIGLFKKKRFSKTFPMKNICVESTQDEKPPRPKIKSWIKPNKILVIKENF